ncbi:MAG: ABC transporter ATP-binding protein [Bacillota bacterium]
MDTILEMKGITKVYPNGVVANNRVDFAVAPGEVHALVGENGAGKTTLMKILFGLEQPTEGEIRLQGKPVVITSPARAIANGIGMVHQHFMLVPSLTVAENIVLGAEPRRGLSIDLKAAIRRTEELAAQYNLPVEPTATIEDIPVGMRQKVEILKALLRGAEVLVLDEPTAVLTPQETTELFAALRNLKAQGHTIIFISHKLREVKAISDRVTVMRGGRVVGVTHTADATEADISRMMVGRDVVLKLEKAPAQPGPAVLRVEDLHYVAETGKEVLKGVSLTLRAGEILGVAGVEGNGQRELVEILTGLRKPAKGRVLIGQADVTGSDCRTVRRHGVAHIPEDRMTHGVAAAGSIEENLIADRSDSPQLNRGLLLNMKAIRDLGLELVKAFDIRTQSPRTLIKALSGGNIQKVVVARELSAGPKVIIASQPTRGVDVGAMEFIHKKLMENRDAGVGILVVSADLSEVMSLSDRLAVMYGGEIVALFPDASKVTEQELGLYMLGLKRMEPQTNGTEAAVTGGAGR